MQERGRSFDEGIGFFLNACPGSAMARRGLHIAAFQEVRGIPGLERSGEDEERRRGFEGHRSSGQTEGDGSYLTKRLVGRTPSQLPNLPLEYWARRAVSDVFLPPRTRATETRENSQ